MTLPLAENIVSFTTLVRTRYTTLWEITGKNGVTLRFTNADRQILFEDHVYDPDESLVATAAAVSEGLEPHDRALTGIVAASVATLNDLQAGIYNGSTIIERVVDRKYPWTGAILTRNWIVDQVDFNEVVWTASLQSVSLLFNAALNETYSKICRFTLGDSRCGIDLASFTSQYLAVQSATAGLSRREFVFDDATYVALFAPEFSNFGFVTWLTGRNAGFKTEVQTETRLGSVVTVLSYEHTPYDIDIGDLFTLTAGCDRSLAECRDKFDNLRRHGGFPFIRGLDEANAFPDLVQP